MPQDPNRAPLGLGLGLRPSQRAGFREAAGSGTLDSFLGAHPRAAQRFQNRLGGQGARGDLARSTQQKNTAAGHAGQPGPAAAPAGGGNKNAAPGNAGAPSAAKPGGQDFAGFLKNLFGAGNPFGTRGNYSDPNNPMYAAAKQNMDQSLAGIRARYAGSGLGNSGREALAEGQAAGDFGAQIGQLGEQAYQNDAQRALSAALGGQQNLLGLNQQLGASGAGLTGLGQQEQQIPGLGGIENLISALLGQKGTNTSNMSGKSSAYG